MNNEREYHDTRCPCCGKFVEKDADGFYDRLDPSDDQSYIAAFCSEDHAKKYHRRMKLRDRAFDLGVVPTSFG